VPGRMMSAMDGSALLDTARFCRAFLDSTPRDRWAERVPGMEWTVAETVAHMANCSLWYSVDLFGGDRDLGTIQLSVRPDAAPEDLLRTVTAATTVLATLVSNAPPGLRGWHPAGLADASGFAAMACDELLVHTDDAARGLGVSFRPPAELVRATLTRLFPWAPIDIDPWQALLWTNGRLELPGYGRLTTWRWQCAPLSEWDGTMPGVIS
jgi:uncharacterized protein (TIGR03083 family)